MFLPTERQDDTELSSMYDYKNNEVVIKIECPKTITISLESLFNYGSGGFINKREQTEFNDYEIELWKSSGQ